jgi:WXG100 family type VII secretion target
MMAGSYQFQLQEALSALQSNAGIFSQNADELRAVATRLSGTVQNLQSGFDGWQGDGAKAFQATWEQYLSDSQRFASELEAIPPVLHALATLLESALGVAYEIERLDPASALMRLGLPVPHIIENIEQYVIDEAIDALLRSDAMKADAATAGELEGIALLTLIQQNESQIENTLGEVQTFLDDGEFGAGLLADIVPAFKNAGDLLDTLGPYLTAVDVLLQFASGNQHDWRTFEIDAGGGIIAFVIGLNPYGKVAEAVATTIQITSSGLAELQDLYASLYSGELGNELKDPANNLWITAGNADFTKVCDDAAKLIIDTNGAILLAPTMPEIFAMSVGAGYLNNAFGWHIPGATSPTTLLSDSGDLLGDSTKLVLSPVQLVVNGEAMKYDDRLASLDTMVQNMPLPGSIKNTWNQGTIYAIHDINDVSDFVSRPDDIEHLGSIAWNWLTH